MRQAYQIHDGKLLPDGSGPVIVYVKPDDDEKRYLVNDLKIDEHTLGSALDPDELARLEFEPEHVAIIFKRPMSYTGGPSFLLEVASTGVFLFADRLVVVLSEPVPLFDGGMKALRLATLHDVLLQLIYRSIFHFLEHLKIIDRISDSLQAKINTSMENKYLINLFEIQKSLVYYLGSINSNGALIDKLKLNATRIGFTAEELEFLDDVAIENIQCLKQAETNSNILASLMDARVSIVSNNLNILIKVLNIITIGIMVPTLIVSIFSMNVRLPLQDQPQAFWAIIGMAALSVLGLMLLWRRRRW